MLVTTKLEVNLQHPRLSDAVYAVQNDGNTRAVELLVFEGSTPWDIPPGTTAAVSFKKPDGTSGLYDVLPDGVTQAVTIAGNRITAVFAPQVLTCAGRVDVSVALYDRGLNRLGLFPFPLFVSKDPSANATPSEDYYTLGVAGMYVCSDGEYVAGGSPTIPDPVVGTTYLVPQDNEGIRYASWMYINGAWQFEGNLIVTLEESDGPKEIVVEPTAPQKPVFFTPVKYNADDYDYTVAYLSDPNTYPTTEEFVDLFLSGRAYFYGKNTWGETHCARVIRFGISQGSKEGEVCLYTDSGNIGTFSKIHASTASELEAIMSKYITG